MTYQHTAIGGVPGILVRPLDADPTQMQILMHGGGFALGSSASHRKLAGHIAKACGSHAFVADFRLAPEHPFPAQIHDGVAIYRALLEQGYAPEDITPVGDSAGANLAIAMTLALLQSGESGPRQVITISPWLDMENTGSTIETNNDTDFLIAREGLQANIDRYLSGGASPTGSAGQPAVRGPHRIPAASTSARVTSSRSSTTPFAWTRRPARRGLTSPSRSVRACNTSTRSSPAAIRAPTRRSAPSPPGTRPGAPPVTTPLPAPQHHNPPTQPPNCLPERTLHHDQNTSGRNRH